MKLNSAKGAFALLVSILLITSCKKEQSAVSSVQQSTEENMLAEANQVVNDKATAVANFEKKYSSLMFEAGARTKRNLVQVLQSPSIFKTFLAAVAKTNLTATFTADTLHATIFVPTDEAFLKLPAPFNTAKNIAGITDADSINLLRNIILYHLLGTEKSRHQFVQGRSAAITLKPEEGQNDNYVYLSNSYGLLVLNGKSLVLWSNLYASNGVVHIIDDVLMPPVETIAQIFMNDPQYSTLFSALLKARQFGELTGPGDFTFFAPTNLAFSKLPAPFNNDTNIDTITDPALIAKLANLLQYHISDSRYFAWDLGFNNTVLTKAPAPNNKVFGILGLNKAWVRGSKNLVYSKISPANLFTSNGVIHVIDQVLKPSNW